MTGSYVDAYRRSGGTDPTTIRLLADADQSADKRRSLRTAIRRRLTALFTRSTR